MAIRRFAWEEVRSMASRDEVDEMHEDLGSSLRLSKHGLRIAYVSTMVAGVSARQLEGSPEDFRYYENRFDRTCRARQVDSPVPAVIPRPPPRPLRPLRAMRPNPGPWPAPAHRPRRPRRQLHEVTTGSHRHSTRRPRSSMKPPRWPF